DHSIIVLVQGLETLTLEHNVCLYIYEISVKYQVVHYLIPALEKKYSPLETSEHQGCSQIKLLLIVTCCGTQNCAGLLPVQVIPGANAGILLVFCFKTSMFAGEHSTVESAKWPCDFTYCTSLYQRHGRSAVAHVPPLGRPYSAEQLGPTLIVTINIESNALNSFIPSLLYILPQKNP
uniref:Uncharacterized protein n=1 Tax=Salvator merianae TaxID=96440 RepID=A0A8D0E983_SALMN